MPTGVSKVVPGDTCAAPSSIQTQFWLHQLSAYHVTGDLSKEEVAPMSLVEEPPHLQPPGPQPKTALNDLWLWLSSPSKGSMLLLLPLISFFFSFLIILYFIFKIFRNCI